jgi:hypothetical protein
MSEPDTRLIESLAQRRGEMWSEVDNGNHDAVDLAARYNLPREDVQTAIAARRKRGKSGVKKQRALVPTKPATNIAENIPLQTQQHVTKPAAEYAARAVGGGFIALGMISAIVGGWINWQFGFEAAGFPGGLIGIVVDGGAALLLVGASELLRRWNPVGLVALLLWFPFVAGSSYAALNYTGTRLGDYFQGRGAAEQRRAALGGWIKDATGRLGDEKRSVGEIDAAVRTARSYVPDAVLRATNECQTPTKSREVCQGMTAEMDALAHAKARDEWQVKIDGWNREINALPPVSSANPAAEQIAQMHIATAEQATSWWLRWLAVVPGIGGSVMLTIGAALLKQPAPPTNKWKTDAEKETR